MAKNELSPEADTAPATPAAVAAVPEPAAAVVQTPDAATAPVPSMAVAATSVPAVAHTHTPDAATTERERCMGILQLPEANGRSGLALALANNPRISVDEAKLLLNAASTDTEVHAADKTALQLLASEHGEPLGQDVGCDDVSAEQQAMNALAASYSRID